MLTLASTASIGPGLLSRKFAESGELGLRVPKIPRCVRIWRAEYRQEHVVGPNRVSSVVHNVLPVRLAARRLREYSVGRPAPRPFTP